MSILKVSPLKHSLDGVMVAPPSKYHTHRALVLAALAEGTSTITGISKSLDNLSTMRCLSSMGTTYESTEEGFSVTGRPFQTPDNILDCGNSGSTIQFLMPSVARIPGTAVFTGDDSLRSRPLGPYIKACRSWGIDVWSTQDNGCLPVVLKGTDMTKLGDYVMVNGLLSPWTSGLLLASPFTGHDVTVEVEDGKLNEASYTELMIQMMVDFGITVEKKDDYSSFFVKGGQQYHPATCEIPGDIALASFGLVLAAISDSHIKYTNLDAGIFHPEGKILEAMERMGVDMRIDREARTVEVFGGRKLKAIDIDCNDAPDMIPVLSILLAHGEGTSRVYNAEQVHFKECDRLEAMGQLRKMGCEVEVTADGINIQGVKKLKGGVSLDSYKDHRVMMAFAIAGLVADSPVEITDPGAAAVSYPAFINDIKKLGAELEIIE